MAASPSGLAQYAAVEVEEDYVHGHFPRRDSGTFGRLKGMIMKHPDVTVATKVGEPALVDPMPVSATDVIQGAARAAQMGAAAGESITQ